MKRINSNLFLTHPHTHSFIHFFLEFRTNGERDAGPRQTWVKITAFVTDTTRLDKC